MGPTNIITCTKINSAENTLLRHKANHCRGNYEARQTTFRRGGGGGMSTKRYVRTNDHYDYVKFVKSKDELRKLTRRLRGQL